MKRMNRIVSFILCLTMILSCAPLTISAFAAQNTDPSSSVLEVDPSVLKEKGIEPDSMKNRLIGDYNNDRVISAADARVALRTSVGLETHLLPEQLFVLDADQNGDIQAADARLILRMAVGLEKIKEILIVSETNEEINCKVSFDSDGGTPVLTQYVKAGDYAFEPAAPEKDGFVFVGWYTDKNYNEQLLFDDNAINEDITLFANWIPNNRDSIMAKYAATLINVQYAEGDTAINVTNDVLLMTSIDAVPDATISWKSNSPDIIATNGKVNRPQNNNKDVILTATISVGLEKETVEYKLTVIHTIDTNTVDMNYSVNDIQEMNNGQAIIDYNENESQVTSIEGKFSNVVIDDSVDALDAIQSVHTIIGIENAYDELTESVVTEDEYGGEYSFQQVFKGFKIYGREITVSANETGESDFLTSNLFPTASLESFTVENIIAKETIIDSLKNLYGNDISVDISSVETIIYSFDEYVNNPTAAYIVHINGNDKNGSKISKKVIMNANSGSVILELSANHEDKTVTGSGKDEKGNKVSFPIQFTLTDWYFYYMYNSETKVQMYKDGLMFDHRIGSEINHWTDGQAISAYVNMNKVIEWWRTEFNRNSLDDNNMEVKVIVHDNDDNLHNNAYWSSGDKSIHITDTSGNVVKFSRAVATDVLTHESTHAVIEYVVGETFSTYYLNAPGAINEGYADTFGCLQNKNWTHGEDLYTSSSVVNGTTINCTRNISNPSSPNALSTGPDRLSSPLYVDYTVDTSDNGGVHTNGFLISHAAYLMKNAGMSYDTLEKLFYKSLRMGYTISSDFYDVRRNILKAAKKLKLTKGDIQIIKNAFDAEEIYGDQGTLNGIVKDNDGDQITDAIVNVYQEGNLLEAISVNATGEFSKKFEIGTYEIKVVADGYITYELSYEIKKDLKSDLSVILVKEGIGTLNGTIKSATTAERIVGVTVKLRSGQNNKSGTVISSTTTNSDGFYEIQANSGYYTIELLREGYTVAFANVTVSGQKTTTHNESISPIMSTGTYRVVLTWGASPSDLDSHLSGTAADGTSFHIYYPSGSRVAYDKSHNEIGNLDVDDTNSFGPETITFNAETTGKYYYYIHRYSSSGSLAGSSANIKVYYGDNLVGNYNIDSSANSSNRYWNVFKIENGIFSIIDTVSQNPIID